MKTYKTNSKEIKALVRKYILEKALDEHQTYKDGINELVDTLKSYSHVNYYTDVNGNTINNKYGKGHYNVFTVFEVLQGSYADFPYDKEDMYNFVNSLPLNNNSGRKFSINEGVQLYCNLITRELGFLEKMDNKQLLKIVESEVIL